MLKGCLNSIETLGALDGPGIRTVFFLQGCNMQCRYCHNRDSWDLNRGKECSIDGIVSTALSFREYYGADGGVTFSGGEPLLQSSFLIRTAKKLKELSINTAVDTSGSVFNDETIKLFQLTNLIILDIKHSVKDKYPELCGYPGDNAFANLRYLQKSDKRYWVRQVVVEGYTDSEDQIKQLKKLLDYGNRPEKIELLPYHDMGREKWLECGGVFPLEGIKPPTKERMEELRTLLN